jgi:isoquinoline 1-oxidoreductase subunit beta
MNAQPARIMSAHCWCHPSQHIDRRRMINVLEVARERSGCSTPLPQTHGRRWVRGIAINIYQAETYMAQMTEVSVDGAGDIRVHRIVCAVDCGLVINPLGLEGQIESGITWGMSATLFGKIDFRNGRVAQSTYQDFRVARMKDMPTLETHIVPSNALPGGFGEHSVPPVAPKVANAVFHATGQRIRRLPIAL